jgi:prevent-host-death family protein
MEMTATDASRHFADVLDHAATGQTITVMRNGRAVAQVGPPQEHCPNGQSWLAFLESWEGDLDGFTPGVIEWVESFREPTDRDEGRMAWAGDSH